MSRSWQAPQAISVLLIDDQPTVCEAIRRMLEPEAGIRFSACSDPARALEVAADVQPTVILQDLVMPDMDGLTLVCEFRANPLTRDVPLVVLSTREDPLVKAQAFAYGANDYIVKLPDRLELVARIRYHSKAYVSWVEAAKNYEALLTSQRELDLRDQLIRQLLGRDFSSEMLQDPLQAPRVGGEARRVTVVAADLPAFGDIGEALEPGEVLATLNGYFAAMTETVLRYGGTIEDFLVEGVVAVFGAPLAQEDAARRAIACGIEMQLAMRSVNHGNASSGLPVLEMAVGISTGDVVAGTFGSDRLAKYGVVGRPVPLASRIRSFAGGGRILVCEATLAEAGEGVRVDRQLAIPLRGKAAPVAVFAVSGVGEPYSVFLDS